MEKQDKNAAILTTVFIFIILLFSIWNLLYGNKTWFIDLGLAIILILVAYKIRKTLFMNNFMFFMLMIGLMMHYIGIFGAYNWSYAGLEYDNLPHLFTPLVLGLIAFNFIHKKYDLKLPTAFIFTILLVMGIAAIHELIEYGGYRFLGQGEGMFFYGPGDFGNSSSYDNAMTDIFNDMIGGIFGSFLGVCIAKIQNGKHKA